MKRIGRQWSPKVLIEPQVEIDGYKWTHFLGLLRLYEVGFIRRDLTGQTSVNLKDNANRNADKRVSKEGRARSDKPRAPAGSKNNVVCSSFERFSN